MRIYSNELNKVPGFEPEKYTIESVDTQTNKVLITLPIAAKKTWFRLKYPTGRLETDIKLDGGIYFCTTRVYTSEEASTPISVSESYTVINDKSEYVAMMSQEEIMANYRLCAIGVSEAKALSQAGFGIQFESSVSLAEEMIDDIAARKNGMDEKSDNKGNKGKVVSKASIPELGERGMTQPSLEEKDPLLEALRAKENNSEGIAAKQGNGFFGSLDEPKEESPTVNMNEQPKDEKIKTPVLNNNSDVKLSAKESPVPSAVRRTGMTKTKARKVKVHGITKFEGMSLGDLFDDEATKGVLQYIAGRQDLPEELRTAANFLINDRRAC